MKHPLQRVPFAHRGKIFLALLIFTMALTLILNWVGSPLATSAAPYGIVSYELAGSTSAAREMILSWNAAARLAAAFSLGLDYLFMPAYALTIGLACLMAGDVLKHRGWPLSDWGTILAWGLLVAAALDALENVALARLLMVSIQNPWPQIAQWCATVKFVLVFLGMVYSFLGLVVRLFVKPRR